MKGLEGVGNFSPLYKLEVSEELKGNTEKGDFSKSYGLNADKTDENELVSLDESEDCGESENDLGGKFIEWLSKQPELAAEIGLLEHSEDLAKGFDEWIKSQGGIRENSPSAFDGIAREFIEHIKKQNENDKEN